MLASGLRPHKPIRLLGPPQFFLAGNPLLCDCNLQWFHQVATRLQLPASAASSMTAATAMNQMYPEMPDLEQISCRVLNTTDPKHGFFTQSLTQLDDKDFLCPYQTHCLALCLCCDFLACDCQVRVCNIWEKNSWYVVVGFH